MSSPTPTAKNVALARIGVVESKGGAKPINVQFNPVSLQLSVSNQLKDKGNNQKQYIAKTTTKLTMDLVFDTTHTGMDVTLDTRKIQDMVSPQGAPGKSPPKDPEPPLVQFEWGTIKFQGVAETYKETIDFFSANGVPLRSSINLSISRTDRIFDDASKDAPKRADAVDDPTLFDAPAQSAADISNNAAAPGAARAIAASNGQESLRFGSGAGLTVGAGVELKPAVAFSAGGGAGLSLGGGAGLSLGGGAGLSLGGGASFGVSAGAGLDISGGAGFGVSGSAGFGVSGGAGIGVSGGLGAGVSASAGIAGLARLSATEGAFSGLRISASAPSSARFDPSRLVPKISSTAIATDAGATFQVGGKASAEGSGGLRADVGATGKLSFDAS